MAGTGVLVKRSAISELQLAAKVVRWLDDMGWTVYHEVQLYGAGPRADIVATQGPLLWIVECKRQFGFDVLEQALAWNGYCHYCSVATPITRRNGWWVRMEVCKTLGIGIFQGHDEMQNLLAPRLNRTAPAVDRVRSLLTDEHRTYAEAGNAHSQFWSPFKATLKAVREVLAGAPAGGLTMRQLVDGLRHHYSSDASARSSLHHWIRSGKVPGVVGDGGRPERFTIAAG